MSASVSPDRYLGMTVSICPECHRSLPASLLERENRVTMSKTCPEHGVFRTIVSSDAGWYRSAIAQSSDSLLLRKYQTRVALGCPLDCGVCPEHQQVNALPVIEITDVCNLDCPICFGHNQNRYLMSMEELDRCLDVIETSGTPVGALILLGGEPTAHPELIPMIERCYARPFINRVVVASNGLLIGRKPELAAALARTNAYLLLQLDSLDPAKNKALRGDEMTRHRERTLEMLEKHRIHTTLLMTVIDGMNDDEMGSLYRYAMSKGFIGGFEAQTLLYTGRGGRRIPCNPETRPTLTDLMARLETQLGGEVKRSDFLPLLLPHPTCIAISYLLRLDDGSTVPFPRIATAESYREAVRDQFIAVPDERHERFLRDTIDHVWAHRETIERSEQVLATLRSLLDRAFPAGQPLAQEERMRVAEEYIKQIFLHAMIDDYNFDAGVMRKCASMQVTPDGKMIPQCAWRVLHRYRDPRWAGSGPVAVHGLDGLRVQLASPSPER